MSIGIDLTGQSFGRWIVIGRGPDYLSATGNRRTRWLVRCACGNEANVPAGRLRNGGTRSCGCLHRDKMRVHATTHGMRDDPRYRPWASMTSRCVNPANDAYQAYGGRGIAVCDRWQDFAAFAEDMGPRPSPLHTIDRRNNNGNYEPDNCRWATPSEQQRNRRNNRLLTLNGETLCLAEWAERLGITDDMIRQRLDKLGWTIEQALTTPAKQYAPRTST